MRQLSGIGASLLATLLSAEVAAASDGSSTAPTDALPRDDALPTPQSHDHALRWSLIYTGDANADISGGTRTGAAYLHRIGLIGEWNLSQAISWHGAQAHVSVHAIAGTGLSSQRTGNVLTVSGIEAEPAVRLFNLWIEQKIGDRVTLRAGQFNADQDFALSQTAGHLVNSTFGWPGSFASDLPSGGPAYPLAAPGLSLIVAATPRTTMRLAVFAGDPAGPGSGDPQQRDRHGFNGLRFSGSPFLIGELQRTAQGADPAWSVTAGGWVHSNGFADLRFDRTGKSLSGAPAAASPQVHPGNAAIYVIGDMRLWQAGGRVLRGFVRATASPPDRNAIDLYADGGVAISGPFRHRPHDIFALGIAFARSSPRLRALHRNSCVRTASACRTASGEAVFEASYQFHVSGKLSLQPNLQVIVNPSAALLADPRSVQRAPENALIVGLRTSFRH